MITIVQTEFRLLEMIKWYREKICIGWNNDGSEMFSWFVPRLQTILAVMQKKIIYILLYLPKSLHSLRVEQTFRTMKMSYGHGLGHYEVHFYDPKCLFGA